MKKITKTNKKFKPDYIVDITNFDDAKSIYYGFANAKFENEIPLNSYEMLSIVRTVSDAIATSTATKMLKEFDVIRAAEKKQNVPIEETNKPVKKSFWNKVKNFFSKKK